MIHPFICTLYVLLLRLLENYNALQLLSPSSLPHFFRNIGEFGAKKYFADQRTAATTIQLFVAIKGNVCGLFFF